MATLEAMKAAPSSLSGDNADENDAIVMDPMPSPEDPDGDDGDPLHRASESRQAWAGPSTLGAVNCLDVKFDLGHDGGGQVGPADHRLLPMPTPARRCSSIRMQTQTVKKALRLLRREEHRRRVESIMDRDRVRQETQRRCECYTMLTLLAVLAVMSLYIVFAHGVVYFGRHDPFSIIRGDQEDQRALKIVKREVNQTMITYRL